MQTLPSPPPVKPASSPQHQCARSDWRAHLEAGKARLTAGAAADGERELVDAIGTVESLRFDVAGAEFERQSFFANKLEPYHRLVALLVEAGRTGEALGRLEAHASVWVPEVEWLD